jgi:lysophospholipase L1-like esterase
LQPGEGGGRRRRRGAALKRCDRASDRRREKSPALLLDAGLCQDGAVWDRRLWFRLAAIFGSVFVCLLGLEVAGRVRHARDLRERVPRVGQEPCLRRSAHPELIYEFIPHRCGNNAAGYPDDEHELKKPDPRFRIVVIGDSIAQGLEVAREERFASLLQTGLNRPGGRRVEVIVLARAGYSSEQELYLLEHEAFAYQPDLIIWSYCLNDPAHPIFHDANGGLGKALAQPVSYAAQWIEEAFYLARERWNGRRCPSEYHQLLHCVYWDRVVDVVGRLAATQARTKVPIVFLVHPVFETGRERPSSAPGGWAEPFPDFQHYPLEALHRRLVALAEADGLMVVDGLDAYRAFRTEDLKTHADAWHPNARGHAVLANHLLARLPIYGLAPFHAR